MSPSNQHSNQHGNQHGDQNGTRHGNDGGGDDGHTRRIIAAMIVLGVIVGAGLWLTGALRGTAAIQDCVAAGRTNCAPVR